jgi:hypothetical protein
MMFCEEYLPDDEDFLCETKERGQFIQMMMMVCVCDEVLNNKSNI